MTTRAPQFHAATTRAIAIALGLALAGAALGARPAHAATELTARVSEDAVREGDTFDLLVSASGGAPGAAPDLSVLEKDFEILARRQSQRVSLVNGHAEASFDWIVTLAPRRTGALTIPPIRAGAAETAPIAIQVAAAGRAPSGAASGTDPKAGAVAHDDAPDLFVEAEVSDAAPVVQGEVRYTVRVFDGVGLRDGTLTEPAGDQLQFSPSGEPRSYEATRNGRRYRVHEREFTVSPQSSGEVVIPPVTLQARVPAARAARGARTPFDDFAADDFFDDAFAGFAGRFGFGADVLERMMGGQAVRVRSNALTLHVKARPSEAAGEWFLPARSVELRESWSPAAPEFRVGEAISRTVSLHALGSSAEQLPRFEIPVAEGVRQYPEASRDASLPTDEGTVSVLEQTVSLVPTRPGRVTLPAVEVRWWDVAAEQMRTASLAAKTIDVLAAGAADAAPAAEPAAEPAAPAVAAPALGAASSPGSQMPSQDSVPGARGAPAASTSPSTMDAAPPPAAARPHSGDIVLGAAALALLLLGGAWLTLRRRAGAAAPPTPLAGAAPAGESPARLLGAVEAACRRDDAAAARAALVAWARATWPASPAVASTAIADRLGGDAALARALAALEARLYGRGAAGAWSGDELWRALTAARRAHGGATRDSQNELPPLYPRGERRAA